jgi:hypothetical protein
MRGGGDINIHGVLKSVVKNPFSVPKFRRDCVYSKVRNIRRKPFVEPEFIPPLTSNSVAKILVSKFVRDYACKKVLVGLKTIFRVINDVSFSINIQT